MQEANTLLDGGIVFLLCQKGKEFCCKVTALLLNELEIPFDAGHTDGLIRSKPYALSEIGSGTVTFYCRVSPFFGQNPGIKKANPEFELARIPIFALEFA